jgi:hypothetical protein
MSEKQQKKTKYRVRNWSEYNQALVKRGSLTLWLSEDVTESWLNTQKSGKRGRNYTYADVAVECMQLIRNVFGLPLRQTQGFVMSIMTLIGLSLPVPSYSTLSRRQSGLTVRLPRKQKAEKGLHVVVDSTGIKVFGHGEWFLRKYRPKEEQKERQNPQLWLKIHLGYNEATHEVVAVVTTEKNIHDKNVLPEILDQVEEPIEQVTADGNYDFITCYEEIEALGGYPVIPPRKNATTNAPERWATRNAHISRIAEVGRKAWKEETQYHRRSLVETAMSRLKVIFEPKLESRSLESQGIEVRLRCKALNIMTHLGMPDSYPVLSEA